MNGKRGSAISRREFAWRAAIASAAAIAPSGMLSGKPALSEVPEQQTKNTPSLTTESRAEAEARYQSILAASGVRFSEPQKVDLRRLCLLAQSPLDNLRKFPIENGDGPALYLKPLVEREKKSASTAIPRVAAQSAKKP
jgi:hypothetical protein